jgi:hypothetical protein
MVGDVTMVTKAFDLQQSKNHLKELTSFLAYFPKMKGGL